MKSDERILSDKRRIASRAFGIWYILMLCSLLYRQFYLRQSVEQYWDIAVTFFIGALYVSIAIHAKGALTENSITRYFKRSAPIILVTIVAVSYFLGNIASIADLIVTMISAAIGIAGVAILFYYLYRRWEQSINAD
jgi:hypothetical protein